jgi:hypothetical protein
MQKVVFRLVAATIAILALLFAVRAAWLLSVLWSLPSNFLPAPRGTDGCPICPPTTIFSGETEQILIILTGLVALLFAGMIWRAKA